MANYEKITGRLDELIVRADAVLQTKHKLENVAGTFVDDEVFYNWKAACLTFLDNVFGNNDLHFKNFDKAVKDGAYYEVLEGLSYLKALKENIEGGYLIKIEDIVAADIFNDFLEMAEYLLDNGFKTPAASLAGAVLEDGLRKVANKHDIRLKSSENIKSLNQKIADNKVYNNLVRREIHVYNELRDLADHGHFEKYDEKQVGKMLEGVRDFLGEYL